MVSLTLGLVVLLEALTAPAIRLMFPGFDPLRHELTVSLTRIVLPTQVFFLMGGLMMATLYARKQFTVPALGPNIYNLGIIFGGLVLALWWGIAGLAWGAVLGAFLGSVVLPLVAMARLGSHFRPALEWHHPGVREVFRMMLPVMFGLSLPGVYMLILRVFGSLLPAGAISALDNANRQMQAPLGIIGQGIALAIFPALTTLAATERWTELRAVLKRGSAAGLVPDRARDGAAVGAGGRHQSRDAPVRQVHPCGHRDGGERPARVCAGAVRVVGAGADRPRLLRDARLAHARADWLRHDGAVCAVVLRMLMNTLAMGHAGLALATSVAASVQMVWMLWVLRRRLPRDSERDATPFVRPVVLSGVAALGVGVLGAGVHALSVAHAGGDGLAGQPRRVCGGDADLRAGDGRLPRGMPLAGRAGGGLCATGIAPTILIKPPSAPCECGIIGTVLHYGRAGDYCEEA
jgi:hypothetical protein